MQLGFPRLPHSYLLESLSQVLLCTALHPSVSLWAWAFLAGGWDLPPAVSSEGQVGAPALLLPQGSFAQSNPAAASSDPGGQLFPGPEGQSIV